MPDRVLEVIAQVKDRASDVLRRIGSTGVAAARQVQSAFDAVRVSASTAGDPLMDASGYLKGVQESAAGSEVAVLKMGKGFQGMRKVATGALMGVAAGLSAAHTQGETFAEGFVRVGTTIGAGFAAGGPVGAGLAATGVLIGALIADRKSTRLNSSHLKLSRMPSSA